MPANIVVNIDSSAIGTPLVAANNELSKIKKEGESFLNKVKNNWALIAQSAQVALSLAAKTSEGTAMAGAIQVAQLGLQTIQMERSIYVLGLKAVESAMAGNVFAAAGYTALATMMQITMIETIATRIESERQQRRAEELAQLMESYS